MVDVLFETEQILEMKKREFLGDTQGRLRELLERVWIDKFKWGKSFTSCKLGIYDDLQEQLENLGFYVFHEMHYGEMMFCMTWK